MVRYKTRCLPAVGTIRKHHQPFRVDHPGRNYLLLGGKVVRWFISPTRSSLSSSAFGLCDEGNNRGCLHACPTVTGSSSRGQRPEFRQVKIRAAAVLCRQSMTAYDAAFAATIQCQSICCLRQLACLPACLPAACARLLARPLMTACLRGN